MRKRQSFLLTILTPENETTAFCGRLKVIASGKTSTFTTLDEFYRLISTEMEEEDAPHPPQPEIGCERPEGIIIRTLPITAH